MVSGARVKVRVEPAYTSGPFHTGNCIGISIANSGRLETSVASVSVLLNDRRALVIFPDQLIGSALPTELKPGGVANYLLPYEWVADALEHQDLRMRLKESKVKIVTGHKEVLAKVPKQIVKQFPG